MNVRFDPNCSRSKTSIISINFSLSRNANRGRPIKLKFNFKPIEPGSSFEKYISELPDGDKIKLIPELKELGSIYFNKGVFNKDFGYGKVVGFKIKENQIVVLKRSESGMPITINKAGGLDVFMIVEFKNSTVAKSKIPPGDFKKVKDFFKDSDDNYGILVFKPDITSKQIDKLDIKPKTKSILRRAQGRYRILQKRFLLEHADKWLKIISEKKYLELEKLEVLSDVEDERTIETETIVDANALEKQEPEEPADKE